MKERIKSIDSLRVIMCIFVIYFHILHSNIMKYTGGSEIYLKLYDLCAKSTTRVDCFLIISGFFLYKAVIGKKYLSISQYIVDRFVRLWPVYFFSIVIGVLFFHHGIYNAIIQGFMLHCTGLSLEWGGY